MSTTLGLVLAGSHQEYLEFLKERGLTHPCPHVLYYEGGSAGVVGVHVKYIDVIGSFRQRPDARKILGDSRIYLEPAGRIAYSDLPKGWYAGTWNTQGDPILHDADGHLCCNWCHARCNETYHGGFCADCFTVKGGMVKKTAGFAHKEGDIWKLPKSNSPMWTSQCGYQGSATAPYIVSKKPDDMSNGSTTSDGWACSCMNFTRHTPRTPCKHILNVMVKEGVAGVNKPRVKLANVDVEKMKAFEVWQREQAARKKDVDPTAGARVKLILFGTTSRKFR